MKIESRATIAWGERDDRPVIRPIPLVLLLVLLPTVSLLPACAVRTGVYHEVEPGQTLWRISRVYGVDLELLMKVNEIQDARQLKPDTVLLIPGVSRVRRVPTRTASRSTSTGEGYSETSGREPDRSGVPRIEPSEPSGERPASRNFRPVWPCRGRVASRFRANNPARRGIRIHASAGSPVRAVEKGNVKLAGSWADLPQLGNLVIILHPEDFASVYAHLGSLTVSEGDQVHSGEKIGEVGSSGDVQQPTCYFELRYKGKARDPVLFLGEPT